MRATDAQHEQGHRVPRAREYRPLDVAHDFVYSQDMYDRTSDDLGGIVALEHVNVRIPDQNLATLFYVEGLGLTRDPYLMVGVENMWINIGQQQIHLPTGQPQVLPGSIGLIVSDLDALAARLARVKSALAGTAFTYAVADDHVAATCPWGNRFRCEAPAARWGDTTLGLPWVEIPVEAGAADGIRRFYDVAFGAPGVIEEIPSGRHARVRVGAYQELRFVETDGTPAPYDGHHIAVYVSTFSRPYRFLVERGLITEESNAHQYRFQELVDPVTGKRLATLEHEVRSLCHPMYLRPLVNRNPGQRQATYVRGRDHFLGA
jgi:hypothetical protein